MLKSVASASALICAALLFFSCGTANQDSTRGSSNNGQNQMKSQEEAARKGLDALRQLVTKDNAGSLGFSSPDEAQKAELGQPVPRRTIGYDQILGYKSGTPVAQLFSNDEQVVYPVQSGGNIKSTVALTRNKDSWQVSSVGDSYLAAILAEARAYVSKPPSEKAPPPKSTPGDSKPEAAQSPSSGSQATNVQMISIPGISLDVAAVGDGDHLMLLPARDYPEMQLVKGRALPAGEALLNISNYAREFDKKYGDQIRSRKLTN